MNIKIYLLIIGLLTIFMTSCNKVNSNGTVESNDVKPQISTQALMEEEAENSKTENSEVENNNQEKSENQVGINYKIVDETYTDNEITITYPQISNLGDDNRQKVINEMLKAEALIVIDPTMDNSDETINIKYKISLQSQRILSVQYSGYSYVKDAPYTLNLFYTANIDIKKGSKLTLKDFANIDDNLVNIYRNFKVEDSEINQASAGALEYILNTYTEADLIRYFEGADSSFKNSAFTFSYLTKVAIGISIEVPNGVGDHMEIELKYDDIIDNIKTENDIWKDLLQ